MNRFLILASLLVLPTAGFAQRSSFDEDWKFVLSDPRGAERPEFEDRDWRTLDLPHDWSVEGKFDKNNPSTDRSGYLPTGIGWYRKTIDVPEQWKSKRVAIQFDGVFRNSTVWANGKKLGKRPFGWISFEYDISDIAARDNTITFAVQVDNKQQHAARWYTGTGIYAHTWINVRDPVHIPTSGVWIRTEGSVVSIDTDVVNTTDESCHASIRTRILDADDQTVASIESVSASAIEPGQTKTTAQTLTLDKPSLWSPENPTLYRAISEVVVGDKIVHQIETNFGVRDIRWIPGSGLTLNGESIKLRGVCQHQHGGALGAAAPEKFMQFRIEQLKAMGCNSIRAAHNPHTPEFYDLCDKLGIIVMDEFVDGWNRKATHDYGAHDFDQWWRRDLTDWIRRDRNHPCVFLYSVGNETHGEIGKDMVELCHQVDPTRPVTSGSSESQYMDIYGMNGGSEAVNWFDTLPNDRVFIGTENTHTWQTRGYYRTKTWYRDGKISVATDIPDLTDEEIFTIDWTDNSKRSNRKQFYKSSYDNATVRSPARRAIAQIRDVDNNAGMYRWTGHDYLGEAGLASGAWPFKLFSGGTCDLANFEKDLYYLYQSQWTEKPMVHVLPHWTHPSMKIGTKIPVWVYSNCDEVELFLNGESLGKRRPGTEWQNMQCQWMVGWQPGQITAVGYKNSKQAAKKVVRTADQPATIAMSVDGRPLAESGKDLVQVRVTFLDAKNEFYPYGENRVFYHLSGPARIRTLDNGKPNDTEPFYGTTDRTAFFGLGRAYIESNDQDGEIALYAGAILGDKKLFVSNTVHIDVQQMSLRGDLDQKTIDVFYTTDGSEPTADSDRYTGAFEIPLGTTVRAIAIVDGEPILMMQERFAADVGLLWSGGGNDDQFGGEQAEDAEMSGVAVSTDGRNYNGSGFVNMRKTPGGHVQWYRENDGDRASVDLVIRYSGSSPSRGSNAGGSELRLRLNVNDDALVQDLKLPATRNWGNQWRTYQTNITLKPGANTIRCTAVDDRGIYLDEIELQETP